MEISSPLNILPLLSSHALLPTLTTDPSLRTIREPNQAHATPIKLGSLTSMPLFSVTARSSTSIGIIFDNTLNWAFVSASPTTQAQIFSGMPVIIADAVGISTGDIQSTSLQPQGTSTVFHVLIPSDVADALKLQIANPSSPFYNGPGADLASHVVGEV
ncbi:hypothetical protein B0H13DRAFT_2391764 [Mycena leptocephala]|nr:hypothetical protein B0H13DRAFT_2391764 [Mycena leptocephala]